MKKIYPILIIALVVLTALAYFLLFNKETYNWDESTPMVSQMELAYTQNCYSLSNTPNENRSENYRFCKIDENTLNKIKILSSVKGIQVCSSNETNYPNTNCEFYKSCDTLNRVDYTESRVVPHPVGRAIFKCDKKYYLLTGTGSTGAPYYNIYIIKLTDDQVSSLN